MVQDEDSYELATRSDTTIAERQSPLRRANSMETDNLIDGDTPGRSEDHDQLNRRTLRKLDFILLPFLCTLFLLNSLDKSNIGNAETAGFTRDTGLLPGDLNTSLAFFFAFFVALQPVGAALGRKFGMARWVPACMTLWGFCTLLHIWVRKSWQLVLLRVAIATLEAGFYPTTVSYLSLFYTRYEFAVRLGFFYGQSAVAGVVGGVLSWAVFRNFPQQHPDSGTSSPGSGATIEGGWKSWEVLFMIEGCITMAVALFGSFWLPHSADTAWFFSQKEREWAERRIRLDRDQTLHAAKHDDNDTRDVAIHSVEVEELPRHSFNDEEGTINDQAQLLEPSHRTSTRARKMSTVSTMSLTADSGLSRHDVVSAVMQYKIWHLLICNILSAIPATAFSVFLPLVMKQLSPRLNLTPAASNLLSAPPFAFGAVVLFLFTRWSDRTHSRLIPILWGLALLLIGLTLTVMTPVENYVLRYLSLCVLLSGSFIASPLTVAWLTNNTPEPGKRAILLGVNGWGNLAGVFSALLFTTEDEKDGYVRPFFATLVCVGLSFAGFAVFRMMLIRENDQRDKIVAEMSDEERQREDILGDVEVSSTFKRTQTVWDTIGSSLGLDGARRGDDKLTYQYSL